jgi:chromate transporter
MDSMKKSKIYLTLFINSLYLSAFTFGGGFVIISFMKKIYVDKLKWLNDEEMLDITTIAQSTPGAIAVNASLMLGYKICGLLGAFITMLGTIIPPLIILTVVSYVYSLIADNAIFSAIMHGMQAGISAIICDVVLSLGVSVKKEKNLFAFITIPFAFIMTFFFKINVFYVIIPCTLLGIIIALIENKKKKTLPDDDNNNSEVSK